MNINSINESNIKDLHILNLGKYKNLLPEVSGLRWVNEQNLLTDPLYKYKGELY